MMDSWIELKYSFEHEEFLIDFASLIQRTTNCPLLITCPHPPCYHSTSSRQSQIYLLSVFKVPDLQVIMGRAFEIEAE